MLGAGANQGRALTRAYLVGGLEPWNFISPLTVPLWNGRTHVPYEMEKPTSFHTRPILENGAKKPLNFGAMLDHPFHTKRW